MHTTIITLFPLNTEFKGVFFIPNMYIYINYHQVSNQIDSQVSDCEQEA